MEGYTMNKHIKIIVLFLAAASSCAEPMKRKRDGDKGATDNSTTSSFRCTFPGCNQSFGKKSELDKHVKTHQLQTYTSLPASIS